MQREHVLVQDFRRLQASPRTKNRSRWQVLTVRGRLVQQDEGQRKRDATSRLCDQGKQNTSGAAAETAPGPTTPKRQNLPARAVFRAQTGRGGVTPGTHHRNLGESPESVPTPVPAAEIGFSRTPCGACCTPCGAWHVLHTVRRMAHTVQRMLHATRNSLRSRARRPFPGRSPTPPAPYMQKGPWNQRPCNSNGAGERT